MRWFVVSLVVVAVVVAITIGVGLGFRLYTANAVRVHPFWDRPLSAAELDKILDRINHPGAAHRKFEIDSRGFLWEPQPRSIFKPDPNPPHGEKSFTVTLGTSRLETLRNMRMEMDWLMQTQEYRQKFPAR